MKTNVKVMENKVVYFLIFKELRRNKAFKKVN